MDLPRNDNIQQMKMQPQGPQAHPLRTIARLLLAQAALHDSSLHQPRPEQLFLWSLKPNGLLHALPKPADR